MMAKKLKYFSILSALFCCVSISAQEKSYGLPEIRGDHPRIFFNSESWKRIAERAEGPSAGAKRRILKYADQAPEDPVCTNTGPVEVKDRSLPIADVREYGREASICALAWKLTGDDHYLQKAKKLLKVSVDAYTEATRNRRPVRWYAHSRVNALCTYDWIYEALSDEERRALIVPLVQHVEDVQPENAGDIPRLNPGSNTSGFYGTRSLLWYSGLAASGDGYCDSLAKAHLQRGYEANCKVLEYRNATAGDDGGLATVAPDYALGHYPFAHFNFMYTMLSATGENIAGRYPEMRLLPNWIWWLWIRDDNIPSHIRFGGQGDGYHSQNTINGRLWEHLSEYIYFFKDIDYECAEMTAALRHFVKARGIDMTQYPVLALLIETEWPEDEEYVERLQRSPLKCRYFETLGLFHMRSEWTPQGTYCTFTAGSTMANHKHFDENNFTIYKYDHLALDTGDRARETDYNLSYYYSQSVAHNVVLVHKPDEPLPQHWGIKLEDPQANKNYGGMVSMTGSKVLAYETGDEFTYIASDATECYGEKCTSAVRQFVFLYPDYFIVYDRMDAADPSYKKEWLLHTKEKPRVSGNVVRTDSGDGRLFCETLLPQDAELNLVGGPGKEYWVGDRNYPLDEKTNEKYIAEAKKLGRGPYTGAWRLEVSPSSANKEDRFLHVLTAAYVDRLTPVNAKYLKAPGKDGVLIKAGGSKIAFWFNSEGPVGGEVEINGRKRALTGEVQAQSGVLFDYN